MNDELPKIIRIMPDYGPTYASDEDHCVFSLTSCFENHPRIEEIRKIEDQLYGLACWIDSGEADINPDFPWDELDKKGLELTKLLSETLGDTAIPIVYRFHFNNPNHPVDKEVLVSEGGKSR